MAIISQQRFPGELRYGDTHQLVKWHYSRSCLLPSELVWVLRGPSAIGAGSRGEVYGALDAWPKRDLALKVYLIRSPASRSEWLVSSARARARSAESTELAPLFADRRPLRFSVSEFSNRGKRVWLNGQKFPKQLRQATKLKGFRMKCSTLNPVKEASTVLCCKVKSWIAATSLRRTTLVETECPCHVLAHGINSSVNADLNFTLGADLDDSVLIKGLHLRESPWHLRK